MAAPVKAFIDPTALALGIDPVVRPLKPGLLQQPSGLGVMMAATFFPPFHTALVIAGMGIDSSVRSLAAGGITPRPTTGQLWPQGGNP